MRCERRWGTRSSSRRLARRMVAAAHFARMGRSLKYEGNDLERITRQFEATRFGTVSSNEPDSGQADEAPAAEEVLSPLQILRKLETGGYEAQMEHWTQGSRRACNFIASVATRLATPRPLGWA